MVTVNVAVVPAAKMLAGTEATAGLLLARLIMVPAGTGWLKVTLPVELLPPITEVGVSVSRVGMTACTARVAFCVLLS